MTGSRQERSTSRSVYERPQRHVSPTERDRPDQTPPARQTKARGFVSSVRPSSSRPYGLGEEPAGSTRRAPQQAAASQPSGPNYMGAGKPCVRCGRPVDPSQDRCPHCGAFQRPLYSNPWFLVPVIALVLLVVVLSIALSSCSSKSTTQKAGTAGTSSSISADSAATSESLTLLQSGITSAQNYIDTSSNQSPHIYTAYSLQAVRQALAEAETVSNEQDATQGEVQQANDDLKSSIEGLVELQAFDSLEWPNYEDLAANIDTYTGSQIAINGTVVSTTSQDDGTTTLYVAVSGDTTCMIAVELTGDENTDFTGDSYVGQVFDFGGVVTGTASYTESGTETESTVPQICCDYLNQL